MWCIITLLAVILDAVSTTLGIMIGFGERGPLASRLLLLIGHAYWLLEALVLVSIYRLLRWWGLRPEWASLASALGPWLAGWRNLGLVLGVLL